MICICNNKDFNHIVDYIGKEYFKCLYLYIDLEKYGCMSETTKTWIQTSDGITTAVMLAYHSALHIYSKDLDFDVSELSTFILQHQPSIICASADLIRLLSPSLSAQGYQTEFGHIGKYTRSVKYPDTIEVCLADKNDVKEIAQLLYEDDDIGASYTMDDLVNQLEERLRDGFVRGYVIKEDAHVVAHLGTGAETDRVCTISYVITAPAHRGKGLSSALFSYACGILHKEGKEIYSVYYPENSRRLHHKMGFEDCCEFGKLFRNIQ